MKLLTNPTKPKYVFAIALTKKAFAINKPMLTR